MTAKKNISSKIKFRIGISGFFKGLVILFAFSCVIPLLFILFYIIQAGASKIKWSFLIHDELSDSAGILHAILGSFEIVIFASLISIPIGILCGIFFSENKGSKFTYWSRLAVDILQGVPSVVVGVIAYAWLVRPFHQPSAIAGSIALAIMMLPIIIRSTEETLNLLPDSLREAGYALGLPFHRVVLKVIVPCGISGILSGVMLSIARVAGETAPLLFTAYGCTFLSNDITKPMETLPHLINKFATQGDPKVLDMAWGAALILLFWVLLLNIFTKLITRKWKVQL